MTLKQQLNGEKRWKVIWRAKPHICFGLNCVIFVSSQDTDWSGLVDCWSASCVDGLLISFLCWGTVDQFLVLMNCWSVSSVVQLLISILCWWIVHQFRVDKLLISILCWWIVDQYLVLINCWINNTLQYLALMICWSVSCVDEKLISILRWWFVDQSLVLTNCWSVCTYLTAHAGSFVTSLQGLTQNYHFNDV